MLYVDWHDVLDRSYVELTKVGLAWKKLIDCVERNLEVEGENVQENQEVEEEWPCLDETELRVAETWPHQEENQGVEEVALVPDQVPLPEKEVEVGHFRWESRKAEVEAWG